MVDIPKLVESYLQKRSYRFYLYFQESADSDWSATTLPHLVIGMPKKFILDYNRMIGGSLKNSNPWVRDNKPLGFPTQKLPEEAKLWTDIKSTLRGRGLIVPAFGASEYTFDEMLEELGSDDELEFWYGRGRKGRIELNVRVYYPPLGE